jgi:hypothetical protein
MDSVIVLGSTFDPIVIIEFPMARPKLSTSSASTDTIPNPDGTVEDAFQYLM